MLDQQLALLGPLRHHGAAAHGHHTHGMSRRALLGESGLKALQEKEKETTTEVNSTYSNWNKQMKFSGGVCLTSWHFIVSHRRKTKQNRLFSFYYIPQNLFK